MDGGPSQMDTFDPKPLLTKENGEPFKMKKEPTQFNNNGNTLGSPWKFSPGGKSGIPVSDLFPYVRECADEFCVIRSMTSDFSEHTSANYFLHTGNGQQGRPSMGAWVTYGLGTSRRISPVSSCSTAALSPPAGSIISTADFFPPRTRAQSSSPPRARCQHCARRLNLQAPTQQARPGLKLDGTLVDQLGHADQIESAISNYELAYQMQSAVPELMDISGETAATKKLYGIDAAYDKTRIFATECLIARRMVERGVRFIELTCPSIAGDDRWDQHRNLKKGHEENARAVDQPIAGLLKDLRSRGMLDQTLVIWAGEFGRTPFAQGADGRDHNPFGYSIWMAGGGVKGGTIYGATDEYGYKVVSNKVEMYDMHATMLYLLGMDHKRLTYRYGGRDMRLTDVHGDVIDGVIA